ncbi:tetratricopeptide repeat protein [Nonomuraea sp. NPDC049028]|uniref:tetratricopeptide repeat protein n=1 Tax=Nonomuraea sp. NPDC049028 TaxID=3364348 RepID=UPI003724973E
MTTPVTLIEALAASTAPIRLLLVTPSPINDPGRLHPETELAHVTAAVEEAGAEVDILRLMPPTIGRLRRALASDKFDIVHVAAHSGGGIEFEDDDGTAILVGEDEFADAFPNRQQCLLVLNGCSTESLADRLALANRNLTTISVAGSISRRDALRAIEEIYGLLFTRTPLSQVVNSASQAVLRRIPLRNTADPIRVRGPRESAPAFDAMPTSGRPTYFACNPPANVPTQHRAVVDRADELLALYHRLFDEDRGSPYIGLVGITGNGKTTIVQTMANRYGWRFRGGIGYFSLRGSFAASDLAEVLGWPKGEGTMRPEEVAMRLSRGRFLLIFDDIDEAPESVLAEVIALLSSWDTSLGGRAVLISYSYRAELQSIIGANWITVTGLPQDASRELMVACLGGTERARRLVGADEHVAEASRLCFGHPKTIEYTASLLQLGQRWTEMRGDLLRLSGGGPLAVNSEMLGRVITLLEERTPAVRDLLDAWAVFEDGAEESAWRHVAMGGRELTPTTRSRLDAALNELHGAALIDRHDQPGGGTRCVMHSLLVAHLRRRHAGLSQEKMSDLIRSQLAQQLELANEGNYPADESGNIRRALRVAEDLGLWQDILSYCETVVGHRDLPLIRRGPWPLALDLLDAAIRSASRFGDHMRQAAFLIVRGLVEYRLAAFTNAENAYTQAALLAKEADARGLRLQALRGVGQVHYRMGDFDQAETVYRDARRLADDEEAISDIDHQIAKIFYRKDRLDEARELFTRVYENRLRAGHDGALAKTIHERARIEHAAHRTDSARTLYEEALHLEQLAGDPVMEQATLFQMAKLALETGRTADAERLFTESRQISETLGDQVWLVHAQFGQALLDWANSARESARHKARGALTESRVLRIGLTTEIQNWLETHEETENNA